MSRRICVAVFVSGLAVLLGLPDAGPAQTRVDNPGRALARNAGRFVDRVVLRFPAGGRNHRARWTLLTDDGFLFVPEQDEEGLVSIGKYRILDADLFPSTRGS